MERNEPIRTSRHAGARLSAINACSCGQLSPVASSSALPISNRTKHAYWIRYVNRLLVHGAIASLANEFNRMVKNVIQLHVVP